MMSKIVIVLSLCFLTFMFAFIYSLFVGPRNTKDVIYETLRVGVHEYRVMVARDLISQARGLSGQPGLPEKTGMLFVFPEAATRAFWMSEMLFAIDIIWIRDGRIVGFVEDAPAPQGGRPATFYSNEPADMVLELEAGSVHRDGLKVGDAVKLVQ